MASQESQQEELSIIKLLSEAAEWTEEETIQKLPNTLALLTDFLQGTPPAVEGVQVARFIFGSFLPHLQVEQEAFSLFHAAFPFLKTAFDDLLQVIEQEDKDNVDSINELIQVCWVVCECCALGLQFLQQVARVAVEDVSNVPQTVLHVVSRALHHCQHSEDMYSSQLESVKGNLSLVFRHAVEAALHLANLLPNLTFDSFSDIDMEVLMKVCEELPTTASSLSSVSEMRGCVLVWRAYSELVQRHHATLNTRLSLATPLAALVDEVKSSLLLLASLPSDGTDTLSEKDQKVAQRATKLASFCVKVIVGLCERFRGYLDGAHNTLVTLLRALFRFLGNNKGQVECAKSVQCEVGQQVTMAIEPLLLHLRDDEDFIKAVLETGAKGNESEVKEGWTTHLLLLVSLPVPLPPTPTTALHLDTIIARIFHCIEKCHARLSYPLLLDGVMYGGRAQTNRTLYEHVLMRVCAAAATMNPAQFARLEQTMVAGLLSGHTWTSLLAADLWAFIARYGTSDACRCHCEVLIEILDHTHPTSHQHLAIVTLLPRLTTKLMPQHQTSLLQAISRKECSTAVKHIVAQADSDKESAAKLSQGFLEACTQKMELIVSRVASEEDIRWLAGELEYAWPLLSTYAQDRNEMDPPLSGFTNALINLWLRVPTEHVGSSVVDQLVCGLLEATTPVIHYLTNTQLTQVVCVVHEVCQVGSAMVGVAVCHLLAALGPAALPQTPDLPQLISLIASVLTLVLGSANPLVYQAALDTFVAFGCHTTHEEVLVEGLGGCREEVQARVTAFLQQKPHPAPHPRHTLLISQATTSLSSDTPVTGKCFKPIDLEKSNMQPGSSSEDPQCVDEAGAKSAKRLRMASESPHSFNALLDSLHQSCTMMKQMKESDFVLDETQRLNIKSILKEMLCIMEPEIS